MPTGAEYQRMLLAKMLMGNPAANSAQQLPWLQQGQQPQGFNFMEDGSMRGFLGGMGREGGGLIGQGLGSLFGSGPNNAVNFGGGNQFVPGQGFMQPAQGPVTAGGQMPMASGFDFSSFLGSLFG